MSRASFFYCSIFWVSTLYSIFFLNFSFFFCFPSLAGFSSLSFVFFSFIFLLFFHFHFFLSTLFYSMLVGCSILPFCFPIFFLVVSFAHSQFLQSQRWPSTFPSYYWVLFGNTDSTSLFFEFLSFFSSFFLCFSCLNVGFLCSEALPCLNSPLMPSTPAQVVALDFPNWIG